MSLRAFVRLFCLALFLSFAFSVSASAAFLRPSGATIPFPGAYPTIQATIDAAQSGDTVLVADGTYSGPGNRDIDFHGKSLTVTSQNGPTKTIIDCGGYASADGSGNHRGFYIHSGEIYATISGFTVKNGYETYISSIPNSGVGGGIYNYNTNSGTITLTNCIVSGNTASGYGSGGGGGGIYNYNTTSGTITLTNCTLSDNTAINGGGVGGGTYNYNINSGTITLTNCTLSGNTASYGGGGIYNYNESDYNSYATITLTNCIVSSNTAVNGGGIYNAFSYGLITLINCIVSGNTASRPVAGGGGIFNSVSNGMISLTNDIIYGNIGAEIAITESAQIVTSFCDVKGGYPGTSNINADPKFVNAATGDLHLKPGSPCLGKGTPTGAPVTDKDGNLRPNPPSMGAYELGTGGATIHFSADNIVGDADGIVCDNLSGMLFSMKDKLTVKLDDSHAFITSVDLANPDGSVKDHHTHNNVGSYQLSSNQLAYFPPNEFNFEQEPQGVDQDETGHEWITKAATRTVKITVHYTTGAKSYAVSKDIILARPPVVLVHGINNDWSAWQPFETNVSDLGMRVPLTTVNHWDLLYKGNDPVETGAIKLKYTVSNTLYYVHKGQPIPFFDGSANNDFFNDYQNHPLAVKRVDVVGWSYGGMITRWYITPEDSTKNQSINWYQPLDKASAAPALPYNHDIRKFFTLGSMWRGVPLSNYVNEIRFPTSNPVKLGKAPLNNLAQLLNLYLASRLISLNLPKTIEDLVGIINTQIPTNVPSMEVMAVNSPWLSEMIYHDPFRSQIGPPFPKPFDDNIAYGSVAGDNNAYLGGVFDSYTLLDAATTQFGYPKSPFPYFNLEYSQGAQRNYSDGVVPLWSSALPGSYKIAPSNHTGYPNDGDTVRYVTQWLNNDALPLGVDLNNLWNTDTQVQSFDGNRVWKFTPGAMAPQAEEALYPQINGIGRINPNAIQGINTANPTISFSRIGATTFTSTNLAFQLRVSNSGTPATDFKITNVVFSVISLALIPPGYVPFSLGNTVALLGPPQTLTITALKGADTSNLFCKVSYQFRNASGDLITSSSPLLRLK